MSLKNMKKSKWGKTSFEEYIDEIDLVQHSRYSLSIRLNKATQKWSPKIITNSTSSRNLFLLGFGKDFNYKLFFR